MTKLFKDATAGELHDMAKGLRAHIIDGLGFVDASVSVDIRTDASAMVIKFTDDPKGDLYAKGLSVFRVVHFSMDSVFDDVVSEAWSKVNTSDAADKRHLKAMMQKLGDALEASEAYRSASVEAFRERIRAMRDDMGARLIEGPKS